MSDVGWLKLVSYITTFGPSNNLKTLSCQFTATLQFTVGVSLITCQESKGEEGGETS